MKQKITIGLFIDTFYPMIDGVISVVDNYAKRLVKYANVVVFAPQVSKKPYDDTKLPYQVVRCKSIKLPMIDYSLPIPKFDRDFQKQLNEHHLDIVHIHSPFSLGKIGIDYAKRHHVPVIGTMHSQYRQDFQRAVKLSFLSNFLTHCMIRQYNRCDECWAVNSEVARIFHEEYHCCVLPKVMNNATEMTPLTEEEKLQYFPQIEEKYHIRNEDKVFLFVGRINRLKNVFLIAESLKFLREKYPDFSFQMLFVGNGQDEEELKKWISQNQMNENIILCGRVTDRKLLAALYSRADLFLFPSLYDASSIVQIEAASQKTPCLFLEGAATTATITPEKNGYISVSDTKKYAEKIKSIFAENEKYQQVKETCYHDLYQNWDDVMQEVFRNYCKFLKM